MGTKFSELQFEEWIEASLLANGYRHPFVHANQHAAAYDKKLCLLGDEMIAFLRATQPDEYEELSSSLGPDCNPHILQRINERITKRGLVDTLRDGISTRGRTFNLYYPKPKSSLNEEHHALYAQNRLVVARQLHYSAANQNSLDMVIFLNGLPIATLELKNQLTNQTITDAEEQYKNDRDPREPLFALNRCLVHFCVDKDQVSMTTHLQGDTTRFLPYNKGITNPAVADNYRTEYLWNEVLTPDSLLDIIDDFVLVTEESDKNWNSLKGVVEEKKNKALIFPRYHQLEVIRNLRNQVRADGVGHNYLVQHATGSGKSYSIGWLAHILVSLYQKAGDTRRMFDTILVLTDRKVLDKQLQRTVSRMEQNEGVVHNVDVNSRQLQEYLERGKNIIITTVQKFPVISETIAELKSRTFAVIIDEVHSSQSGETSKHLKKSLSKYSIQPDEEGNIDYEEVIRQEIELRGKQGHISFFGFTGTPKSKTLELFGTKNADGTFSPFHLYSMKQSIQEKFTLDVLQNYTTYRRYFKVYQKGETDKEVPEKEVKKELVAFVDSHPESISRKVAIILRHFVSIASKKVDGKARGMVVVRSREHCVLYHQEMVKQMRGQGIPYSCLVAFSGSIRHNGRENTEGMLNSENGMKGSSIPDSLKDPRYRILIVSSKYQTGFDEPLLQAMYVDKKLSGVQCVQTLSRLNRTKRGKTDTFVLDFVNDVDDVAAAFQPYYLSTILTEETNPDVLYDLLQEIRDYNLYTTHQVEEFCKEFYSDSDSDVKLHPILDAVVARYVEELDGEQQEQCRSRIQSFIRHYSYISQITSFAEQDWEKNFVFLRFLYKKLPKGNDERVSVADSVDLDSLRVQMIGETSIILADSVGELPPTYGTGDGWPDDESLDYLSEIIKKMNEVFGIQLGEDDRVTLAQIEKRVQDDEELRSVMVADNGDEEKLEYFKRAFDEVITDYYEERAEFYNKVKDEQVFPMLLESMYKAYIKRTAKALAK